MIFSTKITKNNLKITSWLEENYFEINLSIILSIIFTFFFRSSFKFAITVLGSILLVVIIGKNILNKAKKTKLQGSYWTGQIAHLGIGIFAIGLIMNVSQSYSNELIISSGDTIQFGNQEFNILNPNEVQKNEKNVINLPIQKNNRTKNASLNIFKNSTQQAISSPAVFRNLESDTYITIKVIDDDNFKLIFRKNYGIFIIWLGLAISSLSFISRLKR